MKRRKCTNVLEVSLSSSDWAVNLWVLWKPIGKMPVTVEVKHEYFNTWAGRIKIIEVVSTCFQIVHSIFILWLHLGSDFGLSFEIIGFIFRLYISILRKQNAIWNCVITWTCLKDASIFQFQFLADQTINEQKWNSSIFN